MDIYYENGKIKEKEIVSRELSREDEKNDNFTVGDKQVNLFEGTDMKELNSLK